MYKVAVIVNPITLDKAYVVNYLSTFEQYALNNFKVYYFAADMQGGGDREVFDFSSFDTVIVTFHIRPWLKNWGNVGLDAALKSFKGRKMILLHDEYDQTESMRSWLLDTGINVVFSVVPEKHIPKVYDKDRFKGVKFFSVLTGGVPFNLPDVDCIPKTSNRKKHVIYRGRKPNPWMGDLVQEKYKIGEYFKENSEEYGLISDVESRENERIYGAKWYDFLMSGKATLGTESGCNVFDITGEIREWYESKRSSEYSQVPIELNMRERNLGFMMNQISPKIFEAIACKTALVLYEGTYSNVLIPGVHYLSLKKDHSNMGDIAKCLKDDDVLEEMTERTYTDILNSGKFSYEILIKKIFDCIAVNNSKSMMFNEGVLRGMSFYEMLSNRISEVKQDSSPPSFRRKYYIRNSRSRNKFMISIEFIINRSIFYLRFVNYKFRHFLRLTVMFCRRLYYLARRPIVKLVKMILMKLKAHL